MSRSRLLFPNNHRSGSVFHSGRIRCPFSPLRSRKLSSQILNPSQNLKEIPCRICAKGKATQEKHVHLAERILSSGLTTSLGMAVAAKEAHADVMDTIKAGTNLVQKDTVIGIAFGTAILALGAVTIGVIYLSATTWNDSRVEKTERASFEQALKDRESGARQEAGRPMRKGSKKKKETVAQGEKRGFGR